MARPAAHGMSAGPPELNGPPHGGWVPGSLPRSVPGPLPRHMPGPVSGNPASRVWMGVASRPGPGRFRRRDQLGLASGGVG